MEWIIDRDMLLCIRCLKPRPTESNVYCDECLRYLDTRLHQEIYGPCKSWEVDDDDV